MVLIKAFAPNNYLTAGISCFTVMVNLIVFFIAMCKDPGIEDVIYEHYFKTRYGHKIDGGDEEDDDIENLVQNNCYNNSDYTDQEDSRSQVESDSKQQAPMSREK